MREVDWVIPLDGEVGKNVTLFTACDCEYLKFAVSLIRSVELFSPGFSFVLHLINPCQNTVESSLALAKELKNTRLYVSSEKSDLSLIDPTQRQAYYACARFPQLLHMLEGGFDSPIFSVDADSLIVNPIEEGFSSKSDADVVILKRFIKEDVPEHLSVATGSIWIRPSEKSILFMKSVVDDIYTQIENKTIDWFVDQIIFYRNMILFDDQVKFYNIKKKYTDWEFRRDSILWAGKGERKKNDMRFFMLSTLLSNDSELCEIVRKLWESIKNDAPEDEQQSWLNSRMAAAGKRNFKVVIFIPRLDMPWKKPKSKQDCPVLSSEVIDLRLYWKEFTVRLSNAIERSGVSVEIKEVYGWKIDRPCIEKSGACLAIIPHRCHFELEEGVTPTLYYMQVFYRWVFTVDELGWGAGSSCYPLKMADFQESESDPFSIYKTRLLDGKLNSKFAQADKKDFLQLMAEGAMPTSRDQVGFKKIRSYILFPLQIPNDQSIQYFSDVSELDLVKKVSLWAKNNNIALVLKPHPANMKLMKPFKDLVDNVHVFWSEIHLYDLIEYSTAVYTINSGVGFESLFFGRPIVTFGRVDYDCVSFRASIGQLDEAWDYCVSINEDELQASYKCFINWFLSDYAFDMSQPEKCSTQLVRLTSKIHEIIQQSNGDLISV